MRVFKKIATPFEKSNPTGAIILVNMYDPQRPTMKVFVEACKEKNISYMVVGNKWDLVGKDKPESLTYTMGEDVLGVSLKEGTNLEKLRKRILKKFKKGDRVVVLGVFNSGKTTLINWLCGTKYKVGDVPGTTSEFQETKWEGRVFIDSVGQLIDINKPLMVSIDLSGYKTLEQKARAVFAQEIMAIGATSIHCMEHLPKAVEMIYKQVEKGKKIIVTGAGASALIAKEIAGQGYETGLPIMVFTNEMSEVPSISFAKGLGETEGGISRYMNFAVNEGDVVIGVSASGGTGFVYEALRLAKEKGAITIGITENVDTPLGKYSDIVIKSNAKPEGPSSSRIMTAHLVIGHALILLLADMRGITAEKSIEYMMPEEVLTKKMGIK